MQAGRLGCPSCGAPADPEPHKCDYCGTALATIACPSCFGMVFRGSEYCRHCGAQVQPEQPTAESEPCPRCGERMGRKTLGDTAVSECTGCGGLWINASAFERICADRERQAAVLAGELPPPMPSAAEQERFYIGCPECGATMNRTNFAGHSGVVIDICKQHGIWFDRDELRRIIEFIRAGGIAHARERAIDKLQREQQKLERMRAQQPSVWMQDLNSRGDHQSETVELVRAVGSFLRFMAR